jgi:hypothetical protein
MASYNRSDYLYTGVVLGTLGFGLFSRYWGLSGLSWTLSWMSFRHLRGSLMSYWDCIGIGIALGYERPTKQSCGVSKANERTFEGAQMPPLSVTMSHSPLALKGS